MSSSWLLDRVIDKYLIDFEKVQLEEYQTAKYSSIEHAMLYKRTKQPMPSYSWKDYYNQDRYRSNNN